MERFCVIRGGGGGLGKRGVHACFGFLVGLRRMLQCSCKIYNIFVGRRNGLKRLGEKYILF